ncbi:HD domain-containing phosphohydrolase [Uliginosibacterium paludis]|uniref:HD domain-containing phosphohydrolase n=1 Tax=Uliginosibacterium paludis TaxID=1615952 RepID=A0ABV2CTK5_9RHOO
MLTKLRGKILVVDDDETIRLVVSAILEQEGHMVSHVQNGQEAIMVARLGWPDVILTDVIMPVMDGFELVSRLKADPTTAHIPTIVMTSLGDSSARHRALSAGAEDFVTKPADEAELLTRVSNHLRLRDYYNRIVETNHGLEREIRQRTDSLVGANLETIFTLCRAMEYKDADTGTHLQRISQYSRLLAEATGMDAAFIDCLTQATPMHDIGKIGVPDAILTKPGPLNPAEWEVMRAHCEMGERLLAGSSSPYLRMGALIARNHHENWDGSGYPDGISGEDIPLPARIMSICDRYDALRSARPYKPALEHAQVMHILLSGDGRSDPAHLDPDLLAAFSRHALRFDEVFRHYRQLDECSAP